MLFASLLALHLPLTALAQIPEPVRADPKINSSASKNQSGSFGDFEVGLPGITDKSIDNFINTSGKKPIVKFIDLAVTVVIAALVIIGVISITIGGYLYMTAGGDAGQVKTAKEMILASIVGIFLALISVIILNTINKYLGTSAEEPQLGGASPAPEADTNGVGDGLSSSQRQETQNSLPRAGDTSARSVRLGDLLPTNNQEAINITSNDINTLVQDTSTIPRGSTVNENAMRDLRRNEIIAKMKIEQLESSSRLLTTEQYFVVRDLKQKLQGVSDHLRTLRVTQ